ncbi:MAG: AAA family ATPase [Elusimicrobia bacterium]|nr:AAA family ATPase [Elusimicrobiota bacterium]
MKQKSCLVLAGLFLFSALAPAYAQGKKFESLQNSSSYHLRARLQSMEEASPLEKAKFRDTINAFRGNKEEKEALLLRNLLQKKYEITQQSFQQILTLTKQTLFKFSSIKITHSLEISQVLYESISIVAYLTFSYLADSHLTLDSFSLKILLLLISVSIPIVLGESGFKLHPNWKKQVRTFSQILTCGLTKYSFWQMRSWIKTNITAQSYLKSRSEMTHVLQKRNEFGVTVRYIGSWNIRKEKEKVLGFGIGKAQWTITRVSEDHEWGEELSSEKERNLNSVLQEVLKNYPQSRDFRIVIAEGYGPLGSMDLNKGILYLDSSALDYNELAMVGLDHELYHWNNPMAPEKSAIERTKSFILSMAETEKESTLEAIAHIYGEEAKDEILGRLPSAQISKSMEERRMSQLGIRGRVEYFRKKGQNYWIVMDGDVEFKLSEAPKNPSEYNAIQKWTDEGLDIIKEVLRARALREHVLLVGEAGVGKDWLALVYGELMGEEPIVMSLSEEIEGQDLVAWRGLEKSLTIWEYSQIVKAYKEGKIIIIDEVTKTRPGARAILNDLMQSKEIELPDGQRVKRGEGFQIIGTMNEAKEPYGGYELGEDFEDRFGAILEVEAKEPYGGYELGEDFEDRFGAILEVKELSKEKRVEFLKRTSNGKVPEEFIIELVEMQERINTSGKVWRKMSLRVLERIIEAIQKYPDEELGEIIRAEYRIGDWEGGREFVEKEIQELTKKEWVERDWEIGEQLLGPTQYVFGFTWSRDGTTLFSRGDGGEIFYWKYEDGKIVNKKGTRLTGTTQPVWGFTWSKDGTTLFIGGDKGEIFYWKYEDGKIVNNQGTPLTGTTKAVLDFTWSKDGTTLFSRGDGGEIFYWKYEDGKIVNKQGTPLTGATQSVKGFTWSSDGTTLFIGGTDGEIFYWKYEEGNIVNKKGTPLTGPAKDVNDFTWSFDGTTLFSRGTDGEIFY